MKDKNPICPNCGRMMTLMYRPQEQNAQHSFQCPSCHVVYFTPDHEPVHSTGQ